MFYRNGVYTWNDWDISNIENTVHCANHFYLNYIQDGQIYGLDGKQAFDFDASAIYKMMYHPEGLVLISRDTIYYGLGNYFFPIRIRDSTDIELLFVCKNYAIYKSGNHWYKNLLDMQLPDTTNAIWFREGFGFRYDGRLLNLQDNKVLQPGAMVDGIGNYCRRKVRSYFVYDNTVVSLGDWTTIIHPDNTISQIILYGNKDITHIEYTDKTVLIVVQNKTYTYYRNSLKFVRNTVINGDYEISKPSQVKSARNI